MTLGFHCKVENSNPGETVFSDRINKINRMMAEQNLKFNTLVFAH